MRLDAALSDDFLACRDADGALFRSWADNGALSVPAESLLNIRVCGCA